MRIWTLQPDGSVTVLAPHLGRIRQSNLGGWRIVLDDDLATSIQERRRASLPNETGGILVGVFDAMRQVISIVDALPPPPDSKGSASGFERGVEGGQEYLSEIAKQSGGMVRYVGEWHTHPKGHCARPSAVDLKQLLLLRSELRREGLPATMLIAGEDEVSMVQLMDDLSGSAD